MGTSVSKAATPVSAQPLGYIFDVNSEVSQEAIEVILVETPDRFTGPSLNEKVFNHELSREFIYQYQLVFGRTEQEENFYLTNREGYVYRSSDVVSATQIDQARQQFAQYMAKKLTEYHSDRLMKSDPKLKAVYEIKQKVSNVNMTVGAKTKVDMNYDFVANYVRSKISHPFMNLNLLAQMNSGDINIYLEKPFSHSIKTELGYLLNVKTMRFTVFKDFSSLLSINFTQTVPLTEEYAHTDPAKAERLSMGGLKLIF